MTSLSASSRLNHLRAAVLVLAALSISASAQLPANHPPVPDAAPPAGRSGQALPPNHPAVPDAAPPAAQGSAQPLPPGHPPMTQPAPGAASGGSTSSMPQGHPPASGAPAPSAAELLRKLDESPALRTQPKTFEIAVAIARLYHSNGRFQEASEYFRQAWEIGKPLRAAYAPVARQKVDPAGCKTQATVEQAAAKLSSLEPKQRVACLHAWMDPVAEVAVMRGESQFLEGDAKAAVATLDELLALAPADPDALFARGSILLETQGDDLAALKKARADFAAVETAQAIPQRVSRARQLAQRADQFIAAGGMTRFAAAQAKARRDAPPLAGAVASAQVPAGSGPGSGSGSGGMPALSQETMQAFQNVERTPELEKKLAGHVAAGEGLLAKRQYQEALDQYRQVMPLDPNNPRVRAGLAWAMIGLQKPAAERIWGVAVQDPAAVDQLGQALKAQGDAQGAKELWTRLAQSAPEYAQKSGLAEKLR